MATSLDQALSSATSFAVSPLPPPKGGQSSLDDRLDSALDKLGKQQDRLETASDEASVGIKERQKQRESTEIPKIPELAQPPKPENRDPMQAFGSAAGWLAVFGSMLTRQPLTNSLNAAAGVMNAWQRQDEAAAKQQFETWKAETDNAVKLHDFAREYYADEMDRLKSGDDSALNDLKAKATALKDSTVVALANLKDRDGINKMMLERDKMNDNLQKNVVKLMEIQAQKEGLAALEADPKYQAATPQEKARMRAEIDNPSVIAAGAKQENIGILSDDEYTKLKDKPEVQDAAASIHAGMLPSQAMPGFGANNPMRSAALRLAKEKWPDDNLAVQHLEYIDKTAQARTLGNKTVVVNLASDLLNNSLPILVDRFKDVDNSQWTDRNSFNNYFKQHFNDPKLVALNEAVLSTESDLALLIRRGGASTVDAQDRASKIINSLMNTKAVEAFKDQVELEAEKAQEGAQKTERRLLGKEEKKTESNESKLKATHKYNPDTGTLDEIK